MKRRFEGSCPPFNGYAVISSPSLAGRKMDSIQAVLLTWLHRSLRLPKTSVSVTFVKLDTPYSVGTAPDLHRTSLLGLVGTCIFHYLIFCALCRESACSGLRFQPNLSPLL